MKPSDRIFRPATVLDACATYDTNAEHQLLSTTGPDQLFDYDDDGNMIVGYTKDGYQFTAEYDAENRMLWLQYTDDSSVLHRQEFRYSGDDLVAEQKRYENGALVETVRFVRDGMLVIQDRNASNAVTREYTWGLNLGGGIGGLLNLNSAGQDYAYLYDGKGNVEAVLDATQAVVAGYRYDPFGVLLAKTGSFEQPYGFSTKRYDGQTGLIHYEYRPYGPAIARWLTRDPLGESGGLNLYAFVGNNPVNWVDPWGLYVKAVLILNPNYPLLIVKDMSTGEMVMTNKVFSGLGACRNVPSCQGRSDEGPIPAGTYLIGHAYLHGVCHTYNPDGNCMWYPLYGSDGKGGYTYDGGIVAVDPITGSIIRRQGGFNLHTGSVSEGCVTVQSEVPRGPGYPTSTVYDAIQQLLNNTTPFEYKPNDTYPGILIVK